MCAAQGRHSFSGHPKETFRPPTTFGSRMAVVRVHVPFGLQAIERSVDGPDGHLTPNATLDLPSHGYSIRALLQPQKCQENDVLEFAEVIATRHYLYNIEQNG